MKKRVQLLSPGLGLHQDPKSNPETAKMIAALPFTINDYRFDQLIGSGSFSVVFRVYHNRYKRTFAAKATATRDGTEEAFARLAAEDSMLVRLFHPNIIKIYDRFRSHGHLIIILEFCEKGTLKQQVGSIRLTPDVVKQKMFDFLGALNYIHTMNIAHRDIKASNIFVGEGDHIVLADFGLSIEVQPGEKRTDACGAMPYRPPEMIRDQPYDPIKADVWSAGIVLFYVATGTLPWPTYSAQAVRDAILKGEVHIPEFVEPDIAETITAMLRPDENERPTVREILVSPTFAQMKTGTRVRRMSSGKAISTYMSLIKPQKRECSTFEMRKSFCTLGKP